MSLNLREPLAPFSREEKRERLQWLKSELAAHESNIALLIAGSAGRLLLKGKGYTARAENYQATPADKQRFTSTVANLKAQCAALRQEIALLKEGDGQ